MTELRWQFFAFGEIHAAEGFAKKGIAVHDTGFPFRHWRLTAHIFAPNTETLITAVRKIGGRPQWIQYPGTPREHWDAFGMPLNRALSLVVNPNDVQWVDRS